MAGAGLGDGADRRRRLLWVGVGEGLGVGVGDGLGVGVGEGLGDGVGEGVGVGAGSFLKTLCTFHLSSHSFMSTVGCKSDPE